ncbi:hypothetical protein HDU97_002567 [Phlyctochytrium planicorne]|nr:hypothetical protein HDU97_002567 [Phlyctochytrium planicorne]
MSAMPVSVEDFQERCESLNERMINFVAANLGATSMLNPELAIEEYGFRASVQGGALIQLWQFDDIVFKVSDPAEYHQYLMKAIESSPLESLKKKNRPESLKRIKGHSFTDLLTTLDQAQAHETLVNDAALAMEVYGPGPAFDKLGVLVSPASKTLLDLRKNVPCLGDSITLQTETFRQQTRRLPSMFLIEGVQYVDFDHYDTQFARRALLLGDETQVTRMDGVKLKDLKVWEK